MINKNDLGSYLQTANKQWVLPNHYPKSISKSTIIKIAGKTNFYTNYDKINGRDFPNLILYWFA